MDRPSDKVTVATGAGTAAAAVGTLLVWALETYGHVALPDPVQGAIVVVLTLVFTLLAGYLTPEFHPAPSAIETIRRQARG